MTMLVQEILVSGKNTATGGDGVELAWRCCDGHGGGATREWEKEEERRGMRCGGDG
jgi:hypothetical protein